MSFILDALQRADAERARGAIPGLHARPVSTAVGTAGTGSRTGMGLAVAGVVGLTLVGIAVWMWMGKENPQPATVGTAAPPTQPTPTAAAKITVLPTVAPPAAPAQPTKPAALAQNTSPQRTSSNAKAPASPAKEVVVPAPPTAPLLSELPEDIRSQIPPLGITGAVYSDNPAQRLLLVNGQVLGQGSLAAPDVTLMEIRSSSSEFSFRGTRFRLAH